MSQFVADFETLVHPDYTYVWGYGVCEIGNIENEHFGNNIDDFMKWCETGDNKIVYFHNLRFDGQFIIYWLLKNGFDYVSDRKEYRDKTFTALISKMNQFYMIEVVFKKYSKKYKKVVFYDSLKKLPFPVSRIAKAFKLDMLKGEIDYKQYRSRNHQLTEEEIAYIRNDIRIVASALNTQFKEGLTKMTVGSDALNSFKEILGKKEFTSLFPILPLEIDSDIRQAYRGGYTYAHRPYREKDIEEGISYDVNSLYPSVMYYQPLPYGMPIFFRGRYKEDSIYPLYIQHLKCTLKLKKDKIPTIQIKDDPFFPATEYIESTNGREVDLFLTNIDLELLFEHYEVFVIEWGGGWKFKAHKGLFNEYIDYWMKIKETETGAIRELAKLMLNSLYGKFATNPDITGKVPTLDTEKDIVVYEEGKQEEREPVYTALGVFITSWARYKTITTAQKNYHRFLYADTDSIHLMGTETPDIDIHPSKMGAWAWEGTFKRARFLRAKAYIEDIYQKRDDSGKWVNCNPDEHERTVLLVKCAGMPDNVKEMVTWENFHIGFDTTHFEDENKKLVPKRVPGGVVLIEGKYAISRKHGIM